MKVISISSSGDLQKSIDSLKRLRNQQPRMNEYIMRRFGRLVVEEMKNSALKSGITPFTSNNFDTIRWEQKDKTAALYIPEHMVYLDNMKRAVTPVFVNQEKPSLLRWAIVKGRGSIQDRAIRVRGGLDEGFFIGVRRRPFIKRGWHKSRKQLPKIVQKESERVLKNVRN